MRFEFYPFGKLGGYKYARDSAWAGVFCTSV